MKYTVLGGKGFVGSRLAASLRAEGHEVFVPDRNDPGLFANELGHVFYCIGLTADYAARPFDTVEAHVTMLASVLQKARFERLIYLSSTRLYDAQPKHGEADGESLLLNPRNPRHLYDLSKALGENLSLNFSGGRGAVARLSCVYDDAPGAPGFLSELLQRLAREREFVLDSTSGIERDYVALDDAVAALRAMATAQPGLIVNVASGENVSNQELADLVNAQGWRVSFARESVRERIPHCDIRSLQQLGVHPVRLGEYLRTHMGRLHG